jgi:major type 1 subunit fimbrin (pilin)
MKSFISAFALVTGVLLGLASVSAQAADGTITFSGTVSDSTCSINGAASGTPANMAVTLPVVPASSLSATGATAGTSAATDLVFNLTACTGAATKAVAVFENGSNVDQSNGTLKNTATTAPAQNVQVQLLNASLLPINIVTGSNNDIASNGATISGNAASLKYFAQYYATGKAQSGAVATTVQYTMQYQ